MELDSAPLRKIAPPSAPPEVLWAKVQSVKFKVGPGFPEPFLTLIAVPLVFDVLLQVQTQPSKSIVISLPVALRSMSNFVVFEWLLMNEQFLNVMFIGVPLSDEILNTGTEPKSLLSNTQFSIKILVLLTMSKAPAKPLSKYKLLNVTPSIPVKEAKRFPDPLAVLSSKV